jgi:hypothetical protein
MALSENLLPEITGKAAIKILSQETELPFDSDGSLPRLEELAKLLRIS